MNEKDFFIGQKSAKERTRKRKRNQKKQKKRETRKKHKNTGENAVKRRNLRNR